jgi:site-specific DNA-methyltransferase (adenine-specific)
MGAARKAGTDNGAIDEPGSAARFFYCAKPTRTERRENPHPTLKPIKLMSYLCKLVTPPNGVVLDPFMGSGTTGIACRDEGYSFIGVELDQNYFDIAQQRLSISKSE